MSEAERRVVQVVEKVLGEVLGGYAERAVIMAIAQGGVKLEDSYRNPDRFIGALEEVFGSAAKTLERMFVLALQREFPYIGQVDQSLKDAVSKIKDRGGGDGEPENL